MTAGRPLLSLRGLSKRYGGVIAIDGVDLDVAPGAVHAVVGENGAGKSTLMKILAGTVEPDAGTAALGAEPLRLGSAVAAKAHGIGIVYQELSLFPERSVLANLFANREPTRLGFLDRGAMLRLARPVLRRVGLELDPDVIVGTLSVADRQLVELSRVLLEAPRLLILDEPNSALNERETERLFRVLRELVAGGVTALYVSHRLEEVFAIATRITVMRNARVVWTRDRRDATIPQVVEAMVGVREQELFPARASTGADAAEPEAARPGNLVVRDLAAGTDLLGVSFEAHPGEIVGIAGLEGSGVATLLGVLFGTARPSHGEARYPDGRGLPRDATSAARRGISLVPSDRRNHGLMLDRSIARNVSHVSIGAMPSRRPWLRRGEMVESARRQMRALAIKASSPDTPVHELSGGNQQKVVIGKWLEVSPGVVLLDDPTRGVDVGAKREIYLLIRKLAEAGRIVLFSSTELPELVGLADRIVILYRGRVAGEVRGGAVDGTSLLHAINTGVIQPVAAGVSPVMGGTQ